MSNIFELTDDYANVLKMIDEGWSMDGRWMLYKIH